ncbi:GNAT family N-acetyltransferase [Mesobacillus maritimus]|uniref:GNAT family N-acetyltransferase n=1 Tax=Mesobacillus maritimus TaxID=1643336 RepID=UPI00203B404D|nr:GNAT family N-acetyltransferase [Mesobacillus maritimus]MCM3672035.1 GNAT family N-acetyltransferase [Mesobacillus maritimus]
MSTEHVRIVELNKDDWYECCLLEVSPEQEEYMVPNAISIAQSKFEPSLKPFAIYAGEKVVGFLMFNSVLEELDGYWIYRIMIDKKFQGKGLAKAATQLLISEMAKFHNTKKVVVGYHPENVAAHHLYASLGFIDYGDRFGKEMAVIKKITD